MVSYEIKCLTKCFFVSSIHIGEMLRQLCESGRKLASTPWPPENKKSVKLFLFCIRFIKVFRSNGRPIYFRIGYIIFIIRFFSSSRFFKLQYLSHFLHGFCSKFLGICNFLNAISSIPKIWNNNFQSRVIVLWRFFFGLWFPDKFLVKF